ncbi:MAG TPA: tetratricopeptide repeat protein [Burkholderiales bacterium]
MSLQIRCFALATALAALGSGSARPADLQPVDTVLERIGKNATPAKAGSSEPAKLLADIVAFRGKSAGLPPDRAATEWLALWDRARALDPARVQSDYSATDAETRRPVGLSSVLAALPQPSAWPALRQKAVARAKQKPDDPASKGLQLITEFLSGDKTAVFHSLSGFEHAVNASSPDERERKGLALDRARAIVYKLYGSREEIAEGFSASVGAQVLRRYGVPVEVPDLVGLVGSVKAEALLRQALRKPVSLHVAEGEATRALARKLALSQLATLRKPQWGLIDGVGTASLYEAMQKRFEPAAAETKGRTDEGDGGDFDYTRQQADTYYFLDMVIAGRHEDAERAMVRAAGSRGGLNVPKEAMAALVRGGKNQALYDFLAKLLERRPELQAWGAYLEQAGYVGRSNDAIVLIDAILKRPALPRYLRVELQRRRLDALLGADKIDAALAGFRELLSAPPTAAEEKLADRAAAAIRLAALGRVLRKPEISEAGFAFAGRALALPRKSDDRYDRSPTEAFTELLAELRRQGRAAEAQEYSLAEIGRESAQFGGAEFAAFMGEPAKRAALIELAGIYDAAGRSSDVLRLLDEAGTWGARDVLGIIAEKDSLGVPLGLMAARALNASGNAAAARTAVRALVDQMPGYDPAYRLFVELHSAQAAMELDRLYALDQFEERPLIWKAVVLRAAGQNVEAEKAARRAIAIDPSDGEEGKNDRMRAYAVLADILEARSDAKSAEVYRRAVKAIRMSEEADELHRLGLYQRAFAGYRAALDQFSDAYCIQSRLAVQLGRMGLHEEALKHYRRAYELMPDSFGRVESHCLGCESVFADGNAQFVAEQVFTDLVKRVPSKPQAHYMLGYLRREQGRYRDALGLFQRAVKLDADYLNAWRHLNELGEKTYLEPAERDQARLKLFELDPRQRHVHYELNEVVDLTTLWRVLDRAASDPELNPKFDRVYPLKRSAGEQDQSLAKLPAEMRAQMEVYSDLQARMSGRARSLAASTTLAQHALIVAVLGLMGERSGSEFYDE